MRQIWCVIAPVFRGRILISFGSQIVNSSIKSRCHITNSQYSSAKSEDSAKVEYAHDFKNYFPSLYQILSKFVDKIGTIMCQSWRIFGTRVHDF